MIQFKGFEELTQDEKLIVYQGLLKALGNQQLAITDMKAPYITTNPLREFRYIVKGMDDYGSVTMQKTYIVIPISAIFNPDTQQLIQTVFCECLLCGIGMLNKNDWYFCIYFYPLKADERMDVLKSLTVKDNNDV